MTFKFKNANQIMLDIYRKDFVAFVQRAFIEINPGSTYHDAWYLGLMASELEAVRHGRSRRLIINLPPRHLKSFVTSVAYVAWLLGHNPRLRILVVCYGQDLADKLARDCRILMQSPFYKALFSTRLSPFRQAVAEYETTEGGYRMSTSVGGVLTGRGADVIIIDDPMKADEAQSDVRRIYVKEWFDGTLRSRLDSQERGAIIIVMQRLHAYDLVAHVQHNERWNVISLPAIAECDQIYTFNTVYGRKRVVRRQGNPLNPELVSAKTLHELLQAMTAYNFAAQYQQDPQPPAGLILQRAWLRFYEQEDLPQTFDQIVQSWDTANKATELADYSVCVTLGLKGHKAYVLNVYRRKMEFPELKGRVRELANQYQATIILIEDKSSGIQLIQQLREDGLSIVQPALAGNDDKVMRLRAQTAKFEGGFVLLPTEAPWLDGYLLELTTFPNSRHDDQVDATVYALAWMTSNRYKSWHGLLELYKKEAAELDGAKPRKGDLIRVWVPGSSSHWHLPQRGLVLIPHPHRILEVTEDEAKVIIRAGGKKVD